MYIFLYALVNVSDAPTEIKLKCEAQNHAACFFCIDINPNKFLEVSFEGYHLVTETSQNIYITSSSSSSFST